MTRGVPKRLVDRLNKAVDQLDRQLREARIELANEHIILEYYSRHPLLEQPADKLTKLMGWKEEKEQELPLEFDEASSSSLRQ